MIHAGLVVQNAVPMVIHAAPVVQNAVGHDGDPRRSGGSLRDASGGRGSGSNEADASDWSPSQGDWWRQQGDWWYGQGNYYQHRGRWHSGQGWEDRNEPDEEEAREEQEERSRSPTESPSPGLRRYLRALRGPPHLNPPYFLRTECNLITGRTRREFAIDEDLRYQEEIVAGLRGPRPHSTSLAEIYREEGNFTLEDCYTLLEKTAFPKPRRTAADVLLTLGVYQHGSCAGLTKHTKDYYHLLQYLNILFKVMGVGRDAYTTFIVAKNYEGGMSRDLHNHDGFRTVVLNVGDFDGGGIWVQGHLCGYPEVERVTPEGRRAVGVELPAKNCMVKFDSRNWHCGLPKERGTRWTIVAKVSRGVRALSNAELTFLNTIAMPIPQLYVNSEGSCGTSSSSRAYFSQPALRHARVLKEYQPGLEVDADTWHEDFYNDSDLSDGDEGWNEDELEFRRRVCDEEERLEMIGAQEEAAAIREANDQAIQRMEIEEACSLRRLQRFSNVEQWLQLCRLVENDEEKRGVEELLRELTVPLEVVYTVALDEVKDHVGEWRAAIHKEVQALFEMGALVAVDDYEAERLRTSGRLSILPAKGVFTVKPPDHCEGDGVGPLFKRKARLVICGNFEGKVQEEVYASGCQGETLRAILAHACPQQSWTAASTDIRNAFVLAPMPTDAVYALRAPKVFMMAEVPNSKQLWRVDRALYGFRRSPKLWSTFRDARLRDAKFQLKGKNASLRQLKADENVWAVITSEVSGKETVEAYVNV